MFKKGSKLVERFVTLITAAFGLIAALAWNEAVKSLFAEDGALQIFAKGGPWLYALLVTIFAVFATIWISKLDEKVNGKKK